MAYNTNVILENQADGYVVELKDVHIIVGTGLELSGNTLSIDSSQVVLADTQATTEVYGLIKLGSATASTATISSASAVAGRQYPVQLDATGHASVNVPWTDTTYSSLSPVSGGTDVSLVTTGEKYTWNNKVDKKPDGTHDLISNNKISTTYIPDVILGQLVYGGIVSGGGIAELSTNAQTKLGTSQSTIQLTDNAAAITGYAANEGIFYVVFENGNFANLNLQTGDWLISTGDTWKKIDNTDEVTSVQIDYESPISSSAATPQTGNVYTKISLQNGYGDTKNPYANKSPNYVLAGPASGSAGAPGFRALVKADLPMSDIQSELTGSIAASNQKFVTGGDAYTALAGKVPETRTIAGEPLSADISAPTLRTVLNVSNGAQANVIETIKVNGNPLTPSLKAVDITVPLITVSDFTIE